jgi:2-oxo-4-hydroxy-4-carboxy--5-ureidoimidazoline (OHCU) decarboxylase
MFRIRTEVERLRHLVTVYEAQMERDRLERLRVLPDLLAAESRRVAAEIERDQYAARVTELMEEVASLRSSTYIFRAVGEPGGRP